MLSARPVSGGEPNGDGDGAASDAAPSGVEEAKPLEVELRPGKAAGSVVVALVSASGQSGSGVDQAVWTALGFEAKVDQVATVPDGAKLRVLVGVGDVERLKAAGVRRAVAQGVRAARRHGEAVVSVPADVRKAVGPAACAQAVAEGAQLGCYEFNRYKSKGRTSKLAGVGVFGVGATGAARTGLQRGQVLAEATMWARDQVNLPGGELTPDRFAEAARSLASEAGCEVVVHDLDAIREMGLGGVLGVNRGSSNPARFVEITWSPAKATSTVALVGKGITFDSGGLWLKTGAGMSSMKMDMGGAAAVIGATAAVARLGLPVGVRTYVPMTDNMTGPDATRPGDVLKIRNGKTIEVINTDAEGRLILADGLSLASEASPDAMVDVATLTGAAKMALGAKIAAVMGNNTDWLAQVEAAGETSGEPVWRLPLPPEYRKGVDSSVADMKNVGGDGAGALVAGLILAEFVGEGIPWAHIDIAGTAWSDADDAEFTKGGTGFGVRLLVDLVENFQPLG